ncbi:acyl dehydratase [Paracoccus sp. S-4012]|uniref:FAS1-like dehydratase domain-containing protein n=1 Tax=Paracoccus sp. S-4012 TaxID=2665648 RepID=UPI0012AEEE8C|nr:MaoC family dehydratase N-terminal domain-containing protein [Paracoccus sp. S-4012]MRX49520.1 acyl dehydratase [Paracoccus sp. S-4012]
MEFTRTDMMDPARMTALAAVLDLDWREGEPLPPFAHQVYFWDARPAAALGRDGHAAVGDGLIPDLGLPRRMWAGGRLEFAAPLHAGREAVKRSVRESVERKEGRSGPLGFVTLRHEISQDGRLCVTEWQDLVYRAEGGTAPQPAPAPDPTGAETASLTFDEVLLFRYSALTLNGHRIHYDAPYARAVEGYGGLVVHGPLLAQRLMLAAPQPLRRFAFRGRSALICGEAATLVRRGSRLWIAAGDGRLMMEAEAG